MKRINFITLLLLLFFTSCIVGRREGTVQSADKCFLHFTSSDTNNESANFSLVIDDGSSFEIKPDIISNSNSRFSQKKLYQILPGNHTIKVNKNGNLIIQKKIFISNQETMEVSLP